MLSEKSFPKKVYWKKLPEKSIKVYQKKYKSSKVFIVWGDPIETYWSVKHFDKITPNTWITHTMKLYALNNNLSNKH